MHKSDNKRNTMKHYKFQNLDRLVTAIIVEAVNDIARYNRYVNEGPKKMRTHHANELQRRYKSAKDFMLSEYGYMLTNVNLPWLWEYVKDSEVSFSLEDIWRY